NILGYTREELLGLSLFDIDPNITPERERQVTGTLRQAGTISFEGLHRRKDGSIFPVGVNINRVCLDREYMVAVVRDITESSKVRAALADREAHFRMLVEQATDGIFLADRNRRYIDVNSAGAAMLGYSKEEVLQLSIDDVVIAGEIARVQPEMARLAGGGVTRVEWQFLRKDGSVFPGEVTGRQLPDGRLQGILRDISERKRTEETLRATLEELRAAKEKLAEEKLYLEEAFDDELGFGEIIGQSKALKEVMAQAATVAASDATVLILGETGTGKELIARAVHRLSTRRNSSFIKMNCAAIPSGLLESELFGHEKGAFTGAVERKLGRLELADQGTLFLDEIGEIPLSMQPKLLRVLQDQEFERLGSTRTLQVNFRLIAATNQDLSEEVERKEFRSDLYYRIRVFPILVPPLRERREDIPLLVEHFVRKFGKRMNRSITSIPKKTMDALMEWDWAGNIRELENFVERSVILSEGSVLRAPLGELAGRQERGSEETLEGAEREYIARVLRECEGKQGGRDGAAARLGLKRTTLQSKLRRLGIRYQKEEE
ncbi:MAG TPA: sigma 54-interacting transcriptional regulator, partial [Terriglobales bacterium]|nr:sigma 54-interacting transcriptional regulator [Terriglobales bacterium]